MSKEIIANYLLETASVFLNTTQPFTWASGIRSPIYCDNRQLLAHPEARNAVRDQLLKVSQPFTFDGVMGTATAGIPMASILADHLNKPCGYVRSSNKGHGRQNQIEGFQQKGKKVILIEDLISTGGSVFTAIDALQQAGLEVSAVFAYFSYGFAGITEKFQAANIPLITLSDFNTLIDIAQQKGLIQPSDITLLQQFQKDPVNWNK